MLLHMVHVHMFIFEQRVKQGTLKVYLLLVWYICLVFSWFTTVTIFLPHLALVRSIVGMLTNWGHTKK